MTKSLSRPSRSGLNKSAALLLVFAAAQVFCPPLGAQVRIEKIDWQVSRAEGKNKQLFEPILELKLEPYQKYLNKFRAVVNIANSSSRPAEGLVLRCALSLHLVKLADTSGAGFWAVPFRVEELRISRVRPGGAYEARLIHFVLNEQLKKLANTGFWVDALKLQVMLDPRQGDDPAVIIKETVIDIKRP
ncbi:MAG: hypothetical protein WCW52_03990 [Elusimicrobiales bacterium]|jgi:hypothetical protein